MSVRTISTLALAAAGFVAAASAQAQIRTWDFTDVSSPGACATTGGGVNGVGNVRSCADQATAGLPSAVANLNITAFSATNNGVSTGATVGATGTNTFSASAVFNHGGTAPDGFGLGVGSVTEGGTTASGASPLFSHSMDSTGGQTDMILLNFTSSQVLRTVTLGWSGGDGDFQVLRFKGTGTYNAVAGKTAAQLLTDQWELVTTVNANGGGFSPDAVFNVNAGLATSSAWLITAFNSSFGGAAASDGFDAIKVMGVTAGTAVSAPGTLALAGLGLLGAAFLRRRNA